MANSVLTRISDTSKKGINAFYDWLGVTAGSLSDIPGNHINIGNIFLERGDAKEALRRAKLAIWMRSSSAGAHALAAKAHAALGQKAQASAASIQASQHGYANMQEIKDAIAQMDKPAEPDVPDAVVAEEKALDNA